MIESVGADHDPPMRTTAVRQGPGAKGPTGKARSNMRSGSRRDCGAGPGRPRCGRPEDCGSHRAMALWSCSSPRRPRLSPALRGPPSPAVQRGLQGLRLRTKIKTIVPPIAKAVRVVDCLRAAGVGRGAREIAQGSTGQAAIQITGCQRVTVNRVVRLLAHEGSKTATALSAWSRASTGRPSRRSATERSLSQPPSAPGDST